MRLDQGHFVWCYWKHGLVLRKQPLQVLFHARHSYCCGGWTDGYFHKIGSTCQPTDRQRHTVEVTLYPFSLPISGHMQMRMKVRANTSVILLHARDISVNEEDIRIRVVTSSGNEDQGNHDNLKIDGDLLTISSLLTTGNHLVLKTNASIPGGSIVEVSMWYRGTIDNRRTYGFD